MSKKVTDNTSGVIRFKMSNAKHGEEALKTLNMISHRQRADFVANLIHEYNKRTIGENVPTNGSLSEVFLSGSTTVVEETILEAFENEEIRSKIINDLKKELLQLILNDL